MYFSNNSRYVLRKARFLSPTYFKKIGKNLSVKKPKDDPSKPPLRINIPDDDKDDLFLKNTNPVEIRSATFQEDVFRRSDVAPDFSVVESILCNNEIEESYDSRSADRVSCTHKAVNSEKFDFNKSVSDGVSYDNININNNKAFDSSERAENDEKKCIDEPAHEKSWYIFVDAKNKGEGVPGKNALRERRKGRNEDPLWQQQNSMYSRSKVLKPKKSESKHLSKFSSNKLHKKPNRFEVHEMEDEATYILYVKLNKQLNKKPYEVGCVPEKEFTIRTGSNHEHQEMSEGDIELKKQSDFDKERKRQKARKKKQIVIATDKSYREPIMVPETNMSIENTYSKQDVSLSVKKAGISTSGVPKSDGRTTEKFKKTEEESGYPKVPLPEVLNVYGDYSSAEQMPKVKTSRAVTSFQVAFAPSETASTPQAISVAQKTSKSEKASPEAASASFLEALAPSAAAYSSHEIASSRNQEVASASSTTYEAASTSQVASNSAEAANLSREVALASSQAASKILHEALTSQVASVPSETLSTPPNSALASQAVPSSSEIPESSSHMAVTPLQAPSTPSKKASKSKKVTKPSRPSQKTSIPHLEDSAVLQEASTVSQTGSTLFRDEGVFPVSEKQEMLDTVASTEYLNANSQNIVPIQKQSLVHYEKAHHFMSQNEEEYKVLVDKNGNKGKTKISRIHINKTAPVMRQEQETGPLNAEKPKQEDAEEKKYLSIHEKSGEKPDKTGGTRNSINIWRASQQDKCESLNEVTDFQTCNSFVTIGRTETYPATFSAAFPPLLKEALTTHLRPKKNFSEKWKTFSKDDKRSGNRKKYSENSILFPKVESEGFDCDSLFTTKEQIILNIIKNEEETHANSTVVTKEVASSSFDSLSVMRKVKEMVQLDLDNVVKIFDGGRCKQGKELSSVVVSAGSGWRVNREELEAQMVMRKHEIQLESVGFTKNIVGDEKKIHPTKYLPPSRGSGSDVHLPNEQINSVIMFNPKTDEFFISKEALAVAISRKTDEPMEEISETLNLLAKSSINSRDLKGGDSILVFDDETQTWKVDFSILEKRQQQLELEEELTKRSELILETFEELEKSQVTSVPRPVSKGKKTFDYVNKEWKDMKNPNKKSTKSKFPFKDSTSEEIRKKNSDLYENLFIAKKKDPSSNNPEKKAPGVCTSSTKKESKSADGGGSKEASTGGSAKSGPTSKGPDIPKSDSKLPPDGKQEKKEDDNFWEHFLKMNILPKDISEIPKAPPKPPKEPVKIDPKVDKPFMKIPNPLKPLITKKETEKDVKIDISKKITPPLSPNVDKIDKARSLPLTNQIKKEEQKKVDIPKQKPKIEVPKSEILKQPPKLDLPKQPPKIDPQKSDISKPPPKLELPKQIPKVEPPKSDPTKQPSKIDPQKSDISKPPPKLELPKQIPKVEPPKSDPTKQPSKIDPPKTDTSKQIPKIDPPKSDSSKEQPKLDQPKNPSKADLTKSSTKSDLAKQPPKSDPPKKPPKITKAHDSRTPAGTKSASPPTDHYVSDKIIEMSRMKGKEPPKITKIETVKVNIVPDTRLPSKIIEINLNKTGKFPKEAQKPTGDKNPVEESEKLSKKEKEPLCKNFDKYKTPFSDPEFEEKPMKIKSDIASNPNLKKLDNWNKTLVLHDIMKPPDNIETWLKDETDKMATLLLKILQEASDGKPKRKQLPIKPKPGENPAKGNPKKQENTPEGFLLRVRTVNFSLENENKKHTGNKSKSAVESTKIAKPTNTADAGKLPLEKNASATMAPTTGVKSYRVPVSFEEWRSRNFPWGGDGVGDFLPTPKDSHSTKLIADVTDEIPGPEILKKISKIWKLFPVLDSQITIFTLFRVFQLVNLGRSFLSPLNATKVRKNSFSKLFSKYGPIVNVKGTLSGNVILIHKPEHLAAVFQQDASIFVRSVFDSVEQIRKNSDQKSPVEFPTKWTSLEWSDLKRATNDTLTKGCDRYLVSSEIAVNSLIELIRKNRNLQDLVSEDFMNEIKRWSLEGLCSVLFEKSFGFMEGRIPNTNWILEPDKLYESLERATECLNKCERGFQMWRLMPTPSAVGLSQAYQAVSSILINQIHQAGLNLKSKNQLLKDGNLFRIRDLTFLESVLLNDGLSVEEINCNLIDILIIGTNVINSTVGFILYNLALNIRAQSKLFQELKEVLPTKHSNLDYNKLVSLKYLQACIKENFRLHMPIPVFHRLLQNDVLLSNYHIPKGTYVVMDQRAANQKECMFEDADSFLPERWQRGEKWMEDFESFALFPLCHGPRSEFAKKVVELQLFAFVAKIIRNFHVEYHYGEIHNTNDLINFPDKPLKFNFIEREL